MTDVLLAVADVLAQEPRETGPDFGKASPFGLLIVVLLLIGTAVLVWSMNRHLRKLPKSFGDDEAESGVDDDSADSEGTKREPGG